MLSWTRIGVFVNILVISFISGVDCTAIKENNYDKVVFSFVHGPAIANHTNYYFKELKSLLKDKMFQFNRDTVFYIHGWTESFKGDSVTTVTNAYMKRNDHNIVIVDWGQYSVGGYFLTIPKLTQISKLVGQHLVELFQSGLNVQKVHCIGHSFGAHMCGIASREVRRISAGKYKFKRITGLDPAGPGFYPSLIEKPLAPEDAHFVDIIHSDTIWVGTNQTGGHVDFFTNFGEVQPGCNELRLTSFRDYTDNYCSHFNSLLYYAESLNPKFKYGYPALRCNNHQDFKKGICDKNTRNYMGFYANPNNPGTYFLELKTQLIIDGSIFNKQLISSIKDRLVQIILFRN